MGKGCVRFKSLEDLALDVRFAGRERCGGRPRAVASWSRATGATVLVKTGRPHRCARARGGAHGQLPGGKGAHGQGKLRKDSRARQQRKEGRDEEGEIKELTMGTAFSRRARGPGIAHRFSSSRKIACLQFPRRHYVIERPGIFDPNAPRYPSRFEEHAASCQSLHIDPIQKPARRSVGPRDALLCDRVRCAVSRACGTPGNAARDGGREAAQSRARAAPIRRRSHGLCLNRDAQARKSFGRRLHTRAAANRPDLGSRSQRSTIPKDGEREPVAWVRS